MSEELKVHFLSVADQFRTASSEVRQRLMDSLRRQVFLAAQGGLLLTEKELREIETVMPEINPYYTQAHEVGAPEEVLDATYPA